MAYSNGILLVQYLLNDHLKKMFISYLETTDFVLLASAEKEVPR